MSRRRSSSRGSVRRKRVDTDPVDPATLYEKLEPVGRGSFGQVYRGQRRSDGAEVAIKVADLEASPDEIEDIQAEIAFLAACQSKHVVRYYGSHLKGAHLWIIMEYLAGGSVLDLMAPGALTEEQICVIVHGVLNALVFLHAEGKMHRDIKGTCAGEWVDLGRGTG